VEACELVARLRSLVADPTVGLPEDVWLFVAGVTPLVNVDLLIRDNGRGTLLTWRDDGYYPPSWHVPGGIVRYKEKMERRIAEVARIELGTEVSFRPEPLAVNEIVVPERPVRGHCISFLYECTLLRPPADALRYEAGTPRPGQWAWHEKCPANLISVHEIYRHYVSPALSEP
jgi:ADP-ribose pyrophosphatase YjhB (NUDIX family)